MPAALTGRRLAALLLLMLCGAAPRAQTPPHTMVLAGATDTARSYGPWLNLIYTEAFRRLGYQFEYRTFPSKRASLMSDNGEVDGEINRVASYGSVHPDMVRVDTAHFTISFTAYAARPMALDDGWNALKDGALRIEYRVGVTRPETLLPTLVPAERLSSANNVVLGLRKLERGRSDLYIDGSQIVDMALALPEFQHTAIRRVALMETVDVHAFLHKKHRDLAPRLAHVLADMKREGLIEKYRIQAEKLRAPPSALDVP
ncbi:MAG: hypothetical protein V4724_35505 [Pseudomonadota bacterium]